MLQHACVRPQVYGEIYEAMWGPAMNQLTLSTGLGSLNVVTLPHMEPLWSLKGHTASCYTFATNKMQKWVAAPVVGVGVGLSHAFTRWSQEGHSSRTFSKQELCCWNIRVKPT